ncbi:hypothetical protein PIROE2DRAFT_14234 [Piromyces sp. E2]|nr:hypothetical protein PIROE2DRAFT_14234 [Piromyces sp. E2]|eukprot:OUM60075.1 hypothetical protein PIROE2DRAFT_14234 [Piromyces sp. E2]
MGFVKSDDTLGSLSYKNFKSIENFGDSEQPYSLIEQLLVTKQRTLGKSAYYIIDLGEFDKADKP